MSGIEAYGDAHTFMTQLSANVVGGNFDAAQQQLQGAAAGIQQKTSALKDDALAAVQMMQDITAFIASEPEAQKALLEFGERVGKSIGTAQVATLVGDVIVSAAVTAVTFGAGAAVKAAKVGDNIGDAASAVLGLFRKIGGRSNSDLVQGVATRADNWGARAGLGNGPTAGTQKHGYAERLLNRYQQRYGDRGLTTEVRYVNGRVWQPGDPLTGSVRLDVVEGPLSTPTAVYDYKFGNATLDAARINQIRSTANISPTVPVIEVKP